MTGLGDRAALVGPLDRLVTLPEGTPELTLGWEAVKWASKYLRQPNGPRAGERFRFVDSQIRFLLWWYALDPQARWLFRRAVRRLSKGAGKSPFAALMALVELCAPVRLARFDPAAPGGCVGKPVSMPWVVIAATVESQTENTMRMVRAFLPKGSRVRSDYGLDVGLERINTDAGGKLHILTGSSAAAEGGEYTFAVGDEPEHWTPARGGSTFASTLADNLAKSGSRMLETCNAWAPDAQSVAEASFDAWVKQEEGLTRGESKILYDARIAPPNTVLHDDPRNCERDGVCAHNMGEPHLAEIGLTEALEFVYDDCWWAVQTIPDKRERIWDVQSTEADSRRKYLNQPVADERAWVTPQEWSALADSTRVVTDDEEIVMFFDGSKSRDATALIGCCVSDGYVFTLGVWEPNAAHNTDSVVPVHEVDSAVTAAFERYTVVAFFADVQEWQGFVKVTWPERFADQLVIESAPGAREPASIAWDMRSHSYEFAEAAETCQAEIVEQKFRHDGHPVVARHVGNARMYPIRGRVSISKESPDSPRKVDAAVCVIGARMVRRILLARRPQEKERTGEAFFH